MMVGQFYSYNNTLLKTLLPGGYDIFTIKFLLEAAGLDLDAKSTQSDNTIRYDGSIIVITITYENSDPAAPTYSYQVSPIAATDYKFVLANYFGLNRRKITNLHGIKIIFIQTGKIGMFNIQETIVQLATSLGLLAVASLVIDIAMLQLMPQRKWYEKAKFTETKDLGKLTDDVRNNVDFKIYSDDAYDDMIKRDQERLRNASGDFYNFGSFANLKDECLFSLTIPRYDE